MRTAAICPTCATYTNAVCVVYDGPYLSNLDIDPLTNLEDVIGIINTKVGTLQPLLGYTPENVANKSTSTSLGTSDTLYPTQKAVKTYVDNAILTAPAPTLQQVTDSDNLTTNSISCLDDPLSPTVQASLQINSISGLPVVLLEDLTNSKTSLLSSEQLSFTNGAAINTVNVKATNVTGSIKNVELHNASGNIALSVNGVGADNTGDVTLPILPYKKYVAKITQFGSNPPTVDIVLENEFTNPVTYSYVNLGQYSLNCLDIGSDVDKVVVFFQHASGSFGTVISTPVATNSVGIFTWDTTSNVLTNGTFTKAVIEVRIYP